jgi:acyl-CoA dehydrogenase family member 9
MQFGSAEPLVSLQWMPDPSPSPLRDLFAGKMSLRDVLPYPLMARARYLQVEPVLRALRQRHDQSGLDLLVEHDLLSRPDGLPWLSQVRIAEQLGSADPAAALSFIAHHALGRKLVRRFGTEAARAQLHPSNIFSFALTESSPGSDVSQVQTIARPVHGGFRLDGAKHWVTNGLRATHFVVLARTTSMQPGNKPRLTAFLVPMNAGIQVQPVRSQVLPGSMVAELHLKDVFVPDEFVLGQVGKGFRVVVDGLADARLLLSGAIAGACTRAYNDTVERLNQRRAFGRPVGNFPSVQDRTASLLAKTFALESMVFLAAGLGERHSVPDPVERALSRLAASRLSAQVLDTARELHGAAAFSADSAQARRWADTRALALLDGSDLALESLIALEGTRDMRKVLAKANENYEPIVKLDEIGQKAVQKLKSTVRHALPEDLPFARLHSLERLTAEFGEQVEVQIRRFGTEFVERQHTHRRVANVAMELALWIAVVARVQTEISRTSMVGAQRMVDLVSLFTQGAEQRVADQLAQLSANEDDLRDRIARRAYSDGGYPFDVL